MAMASWLKATPTSGAGNGSVSVSTTEPHTGRTSRSTSVTFKASGVEDKKVTVNQAGKPEFVTIQSAAAAASTGTMFELGGVSNSTKLTFELGIGNLDIELPSSYLANSISADNGVAIKGDPGASAEFSYTIPITVNPNNGVEEKSRQIIAKSNNGQTVICTVTQAAGDPTLSVSPTTINLTYEGSAKSITVTSNTNWTVE